LALGDYAVNFGQGLIQWHSLGFAKGSEAIIIKRQSPTLVPYRAAGEFNFYRGAAACLKKGFWEATAFVSRRNVSGNIIHDSTKTFSAFQASGYNRTASEVADRNKIREFTVGGNFKFRRNTFEIGLNSILHQFDHFLRKKDEPYNSFAFSGSESFNSSVDYSFGHKNLHLFGEAAIDKNKNAAVVQGFIVSVDPKVDVSLFYRNLSRAYQSLYASTFAEGSQPANEKGIYSGITIRPSYMWTVNAYADFYRFPWLRYRLDAAAQGCDYLIHLLYRPNKQTELSARFRSEDKPSNAQSENNTRYPEAQPRRSVRIHFSTQPGPTLLFRWRVEMVWFQRRQARDEGFLGYFETSKKVGNHLKCNGRLQYVETGSYDSRIYAYESDVLYSFSIPAFYNKGLRYYLNLTYDITNKTTCWIRFAQMLYRNKEHVGSGMDELNGRTKTEIKAQFQLLL
jgi:hypothetical protein